MQQQRLNNATTTIQQMQHNYACGTNRATAPFAKVIIRLVRLQFARTQTGNLLLNNSLGEFNYSLWRATVSTR